MWRPFWDKGPSWPWSYGSWIYNYLSNQCQSLLMFWVRISIRARCTTLSVCQWLATGRWFSPSPPPIKLTASPRYNWNIVENGVKHHQTNKPFCDNTRQLAHIYVSANKSFYTGFWVQCVLIFIGRVWYMWEGTRTYDAFQV